MRPKVNKYEFQGSLEENQKKFQDNSTIVQARTQKKRRAILKLRNKVRTRTTKIYIMKAQSQFDKLKVEKKKITKAEEKYKGRNPLER